MIEMKKKIVMMVVLTLTAYFFCGVTWRIVFPHPAGGLGRVLEASITVGGEGTPENGVPGGPPGTPG